MSNQLMLNYHDAHKGESCLVVGNGPSLKDVPLDFLNENITFGTNKIYLLQGFRFTYYVSVNPLVIEQSRDYITNHMFQPRFLREDSQIPCIPLHSMSIPMFSYDPSRYIYEGHTVTFVALQLAFFMGFVKVGLVGVDHRFEYEGEPNEERVLEGDDPNHFDPEYFKGMKWNNPDLARSEEAYAMAKVAFESVGRKIFNLTPNSNLEVFEHMEMEQWQSGI